MYEINVVLSDGPCHLMASPGGVVQVPRSQSARRLVMHWSRARW